MLPPARVRVGGHPRHDGRQRVGGANVVARGQLRITAPTVFGRLFIIPLIKEYLALYPEMEISAIFLDRTVNLIDEGFDVAIRIAELPDSATLALARDLLK